VISCKIPGLGPWMWGEQMEKPKAKGRGFFVERQSS
jgi:hypothetical protein